MRIFKTFPLLALGIEFGQDEPTLRCEACGVLDPGRIAWIPGPAAGCLTVLH